MNSRALLAVPMIAAAFLTGCTTGTGTQPSASPSAVSPTPIFDTQAAAALVAAGVKSGSGSYRMHATMSFTPSTGNVELDMLADPTAKRMRMTIVNNGQTLEARLIGTDLYMTGLPQIGKKWMKVDTSQIQGYDQMFSMSEQNFAMLGGIVELTAGPNGTFQGKIDPKAALDRAGSDQIHDALAKVATMAGADAKLPFTAKITEGYLTEMTIEYPTEVNNQVVQTKITMTLSDFGKPVIVTPPPAKDLIQQP
jgi:hypothetical protein